MVTFAHDPTRVHPPASAVDGGYPSIAKEAQVTISPLAVATGAEAEAPRTTPTYSDGQTLVSIALGESGGPHRIVYVFTERIYRNQGKMRAKMEQILGDMDHDGRDSMIFINNTDPDCDIPRLQAFFESLGYDLQEIDPAYPPLQLYRPVIIT